MPDHFDCRLFFEFGGSRVLGHSVTAFFIVPKEREKELRRIARRRGLKGKRADNFVYGTMVNEGWRPRGKNKGKKE